MPVRGTRINASYMGLAARVAAILLGVLILLAQSYADYKQMAGDHPDLTYQLNGGQILLPALLLLVIAALVAVVAALAISDSGRTYLHTLQHDWNNVVDWIQDKFS